MEPVPHPAPLITDGIPERFRGDLAACAAGTVSPHMALMHLYIEAATFAEANDAIIAALGSAPDNRNLLQLADLARANPEGWQVVRGVLAAVDHDSQSATPQKVVERFAAMFDRAVAVSPEGSVALYSFGNVEQLARATAEIVTRLDEWNLVGPDARILEIGCGIGRFATALAPRVRSFTGLDVSTEMVRTARERTADLENVEILLGTGLDLANVFDRSVECVLAVDSMPYIVEAGAAVTDTHFAEISRVLVPGGTLAILNFSYRGELGQNRDAFADLCARHGFTVERCGTRDFTLWDGKAFVARKPE